MPGLMKIWVRRKHCKEKIQFPDCTVHRNDLSGETANFSVTVKETDFTALGAKSLASFLRQGEN